MNRRDIEALRRRVREREEVKEEPALIVWAAGLLFAALIVISNFI
jgi:hypothetical protein